MGNNFGLTNEQKAQAAYEAVSSTCAVLGIVPWGRWAHLSDASRKIIVSVVRSVGVMNGDYSPELAHEHWVERQLTKGWKHGPVFDEINKIHPYLIAFSELPRDAQIREAVFCAVIKAL